MLEGDVPSSSKKKLDKNQPVDVTVTVDGKKSEKSDTEDPKPRIVLTFRSEKSGSKSSNMKIVSSEEKQEEVSPRRSSRTRSKWEWTEESDSPKKDKNCVSENEEVSDSSAPKRSSRRRSKDSAENVLATAIARKEKSYNETPPTQRLSRRIKPTAKILANEELRIGLESQNNARLGIQPEKEGGVRTRRSARPIAEQSADVKDLKMKMDDSAEDQEDEMKLKHLCELGLKAKDTEATEDDEDGENRDSDECEIVEEDEEIDDDSEVISKLLEADDETISEGSDDDFSCSDEASQTDKGPRTRRSTRLNSSYGNNESEESSTVPDDDKTPPRRSSRRSTRHYYDEENNPDNDPEYAPRRKKTRVREEPQSEATQEENSNPAGGDEGSEAVCPEDGGTIVATCYCETPSNVYAAPDELEEPVFCQAIEMVDGVRVGCSHLARREGGALAAMIRAGPRAPYLLACALHAEQMRNHMCCPACGLFCTQGVFYQCSEKHLFHLECGLPYNEAKSSPGCPHCGVSSYRWSAANQRVVSVRVSMRCSNKRILLPERRRHCTPAYLSFSTLPEAQTKLTPLIPEDLLPTTAVDLELLKVKPEGDESDSEMVLTLLEAIVGGENAEQLVAKIASVRNINTAVDDKGLTLAHVAAQNGRLLALYLLHCAGADLNACDDRTSTPLILATQALLDKDGIAKSPKHLKDSVENMEVDQEEIKLGVKEEDTSKERLEETQEEKEGEVNSTEETVSEEVPTKGGEELKEVSSTGEKEIKEEVKEGETVTEDKSEAEEVTNDVDEEELFRVIRFLVAAGCDVNFPGPEGMSALHMCAAHGGIRAYAIAQELLSSGAAADVTDQGGWTPLVWAAEHGHADILRLLLKHGANANVKDKEGNAAIHWCCLAGDSSCLLLLLDASPAAGDQLNQNQDTPLHIAARHGHYSCVVILLARGARTQVKNAAGETPLDVCGEHDNCRNAISLNIQMTNLSRTGKHRLLCNDLSRGREQYPVPCVNEVDDTPAPDDFTYVTSHVMTEKIIIDNTIATLQGCTCKQGSCDDSCACSTLSVRSWYSGGRLLPSFSHRDPPMLFECNYTCGCDLNECGNNVITRLASKGSLGIRACVFRHSNSVGWGLRARQHVSRGSAVALYCGELLSLETADTRPVDQYMFALDVKPDLLEQCSEKTILCVDAARYGSAARFINHSCRPNLAPVRVFTTCRDLRLPAVALFATDSIAPGDELTFDYGDKFWSVKAKWMKCECGTPECRYPEAKEEDDS